MLSQSAISHMKRVLTDLVPDGPGRTVFDWMLTFRKEERLRRRSRGLRATGGYESEDLRLEVSSQRGRPRTRLREEEQRAILNLAELYDAIVEGKIDLVREWTDRRNEQLNRAGCAFDNREERRNLQREEAERVRTGLLMVGVYPGTVRMYALQSGGSEWEDVEPELLSKLADLYDDFLEAPAYSLAKEADYPF